jgi:hypothetical protein
VLVFLTKFRVRFVAVLCRTNENPKFARANNGTIKNFHRY